MPDRVPATSSKDKRVERGIASRDLILVEATRLFADKGLRGTSITDIAAAAGVNRAMIAYHFGSKGGLYDAIIDGAVSDAAAAVAELDLESDRSSIRKWILALAGVLAKRPHLGRMIIYEYFERGHLFEPETATKLSGFVRLTNEILDAADLPPRSRGYDPQVIHLIIVGALNYFLLTAPFREEMGRTLGRPITIPSVDEFADTLADLVSRGLLDPAK